jgi:hypothetical protein
MDLMPNQIIIFVVAQSILAIVLIVRYARRSRREKMVTTESGAAPQPETEVRGPQPWVWVATVVLIAAVVLLWRPCSTWYSARYAPIILFRSQLLEAASKEIHCPADQLTIEVVGDREAKVTGCGGNTRLCWRKSIYYGWLGCYVPY